MDDLSYTVEELLDQARNALRDAGPVTRELVAKRIDKFFKNSAETV